jgi:hypothetical protein
VKLNETKNESQPQHLLFDNAKNERSKTTMGRKSDLHPAALDKFK